MKVESFSLRASVDTDSDHKLSLDYTKGGDYTVLVIADETTYKVVKLGLDNLIELRDLLQVIVSAELDEQVRTETA